MKLKEDLVSRHQSRRKTWLIRGVVAALVVVMAGGAAWFFLGRSSTTAQASSSRTNTAISQSTTVKRGDIRVTATGSATLVASQSVDLSFSTSGTVSDLNVKLGDTVKTGDVLARLGNASSLEADVAAAELKLLEAQNTLADLQKSADLNLATAYQTLVTAQATYDTALATNQRMSLARCSKEVMTQYKTEYDRVVERLALFEKGSAQWIIWNDEFATASANYNYCLGHTETEKNTAQANFDVAKTSLKLAQDAYDTMKNASGIDPVTLADDEAKVKQAETDLATAREALVGITLTASIDGKIVYLAAEKGAIVDTSKYITIADISPSTLSVSVDETDLDKLVVDNTVTATFDALPDETFNGKVIQVDPQLTTSGQYKVAKGEVELDTDATRTVQELPLGVNATVTILQKEAKNVLVIPITALKDLGSKKYAVMLVGKNGALTQQDVQIGLKDSKNVEITSGLNEGDSVSSVVVSSTSSSSSSTTKTNSSEMGLPPDGGMPPGQ
jgi:HlyD family secretion protein